MYPFISKGILALLRILNELWSVVFAGGAYSKASND